MAIELNKTTFRRLVWLYVASLVALVGSITFEIVDSKFAAFTTEFDQLAARYYESFDDWNETVLMVLAGIVTLCSVWAIASIVGMLRFKRWGRFGFWAPLIVAFPLLVILPVYPAVTTAMTEIALMLNTALFGAILLIAYARGLGDSWFNSVEESGI